MIGFATALRPTNGRGYVTQTVGLREAPPSVGLPTHAKMPIAVRISSLHFSISFTSPSNDANSYGHVRFGLNLRQHLHRNAQH